MFTLEAPALLRVKSHSHFPAALISEPWFLKPPSQDAARIRSLTKQEQSINECPAKCGSLMWICVCAESGVPAAMNLGEIICTPGEISSSHRRRRPPHQFALARTLLPPSATFQELCNKRFHPSRPLLVERGVRTDLIKHRSCRRRHFRLHKLLMRARRHTWRRQAQRLPLNEVRTARPINWP